MTLSDAQSPLARAFLDLVPDTLRSYVTADPGVILRVPARATEVGDLVVSDEKIELTVRVGNVDHCHFEAYCEIGDTQGDRERQAAERALRWISEVIADRVRFRKEFRAGELIACSSWRASEEAQRQLIPSADECREYTWSGEKVHEYRSGNP